MHILSIFFFFFHTSSRNIYFTSFHPFTNWLWNFSSTNKRVMTSLSSIHCYMHALCKLPSPFIIKYLKKWGENNSKMKALNKLEMVAMFWFSTWISNGCHQCFFPQILPFFNNFLGFKKKVYIQVILLFFWNFLIKFLYKIFVKKKILGCHFFFYFKF